MWFNQMITVLKWIIIVFKPKESFAQNVHKWTKNSKTEQIDKI